MTTAIDIRPGLHHAGNKSGVVTAHGKAKCQVSIGLTQRE